MFVNESDRGAIKPSRLRNFDLKIGDKVRFIQNTDFRGGMTLTGCSGVRRKGTVIGIYPHVFMVEYRTGVDDSIGVKQGLRKLDYQLGEIKKIEY